MPFAAASGFFLHLSFVGSLFHVKEQGDLKHPRGSVQFLLKPEIFFGIPLPSRLKWIGSIFLYDGSTKLTGRGVSRVNYEVPRLSKLQEDARRCFKYFQQVWYELEMFKVCYNDMLCEVQKYQHICNFGIFEEC